MAKAAVPADTAGAVRNAGQRAVETSPATRCRAAPVCGRATPCRSPTRSRPLHPRRFRAARARHDTAAEARDEVARDAAAEERPGDDGPEASLVFETRALVGTRKPKEQSAQLVLARRQDHDHSDVRSEHDALRRFPTGA
jgi:hypothetical protein